jgi:excisionase family DNA binding protein
MEPVESAGRKLPYDASAPTGRVEVSYSNRNWPAPSFEPEKLETLAALIASRLQQAREDRAPGENKQLMTARQAAEFLAVDRKTVYRHARELGGRKVGRTWRFDLDAAATDPTETSARYASETPQRSESPTPRSRRRRDGRDGTEVRCQLLPIGRASERAR